MDFQMAMILMNRKRVAFPSIFSSLGYVRTTCPSLEGGGARGGGGASLPTGFSLIRVPSTGNLGHGVVDQKLCDLH